MPRTLDTRGVMTAAGLLTMPAQIDAADPVGLTDAFESSLSLDQGGNCRIRIGAVSAGVNVPTIPGVATGSAGVLGHVVGPGAGAAIATLAALAAGTYDVQVFVLFDVGAPVAADLNNMEFRRDATVITSLQVLTVINVYAPARIIRVTLNGAQNISVNATGAATAGVGYSAELIATRIT